MIPLEQQCVSLLLARRLKELKVEQKSLFWWNPYFNHNDNLRYEIEVGEGVSPHWGSDTIDPISAFTVAELGAMLRCHFDTFFGGRLWYVTSPTSGREFTAETEADARAQMLIHLLESGALSTNEK